MSPIEELVEDAKAQYQLKGFIPERYTIFSYNEGLVCCCAIGAAILNKHGVKIPDEAEALYLKIFWIEETTKIYGLTSFEIFSFIRGFDARSKIGCDLNCYEAGKKFAESIPNFSCL